ncbi:DUF6879 family protein [Pilimelia columellifera]|uniref:DUF6879 domain-containing protein n=1 Tax=Pilimelia columellifera subsp. columellifera TaxID=706583 RepID=A0ABP6AYJ3_9ACTN
MRKLSYQEFVSAYKSITSSWAHMELRDGYGAPGENPALDRWLDTGHDDGEWLADWYRTVEDLGAAGKAMRRLKVVSEPLSGYHRWVRDSGNADRIVACGELTRWVSREVVAEANVLLPAADFYVLDDRRVMFLYFAGSGEPTSYSITDDPIIVAACSTAFEQAWKLSINHDVYRSL